MTKYILTVEIEAVSLAQAWDAACRLPSNFDSSQNLYGAGLRYFELRSDGFTGEREKRLAQVFSNPADFMKLPA